MREPPAAHLPHPHPVTRLAPSPTGGLHLGNAFSFVINWALARKHNWDIILRIEDLDNTRVKPGMIEDTIALLRWLGLDWDSGPFTQSDDYAAYRAAMQTLAEHARVYPCALTRSQIEAAASAPHATATPESRFNPSLRPQSRPTTFDDAGTNWRLIVDPGEIRFTDALMGPQRFDLDTTSGDFVVWTKRSAPSYQLAVVVDDAASGVTQVVRGNDLLDSAARQLLLYRALHLTPEPAYTHLPLIRGEDGRRLAKRDADTRIDTYSGPDSSPQRVIGLIAHWCGITPEPAAMSLAEFQSGFSLDTLTHDDIVFTKEDAAWLSA